MSNKYYVVTAISQYRMRYVIPVEDLMDEDGNVSKVWALDSVVMEEVEEFSQDHIGETVIDVVEEDEETVLARFDEENSYLNDWTLEHKVKYIRDWRHKE
jgi:hypothetical protein